MLYFIVFSSVYFLYYANYSFYVTNTVIELYNRINLQDLFKKSNIFINNKLLENDQDVLNFISNARTRTILNENGEFNKKKCPLVPPNMRTRIPINFDKKKETEIENELRNFNISVGGLWNPKDCNSRFKVGIIIPFRDRQNNLELLLKNLHPFLIKQQLDYGIYLIEPIANITFNRGLLMNIGFVESLKLSNNKWNCFIFHDVDLIPEDERNLYSCPEVPRHFSSAVSTLKYRLPYDAIFGGVTGFGKEHFSQINGFSNQFFGWGGEDDDIRKRVLSVGLNIGRYPLEIGRYYMANHEKDKPNPLRYNLLKTSKSRMDVDGISSLKYDALSVKIKKLYTKIIVNYNQNDILKIKL